MAVGRCTHGIDPHTDRRGAQSEMIRDLVAPGLGAFGSRVPDSDGTSRVAMFNGCVARSP